MLCMYGPHTSLLQKKKVLDTIHLGKCFMITKFILEATTYHKEIL